MNPELVYPGGAAEALAAEPPVEYKPYVEAAGVLFCDGAGATQLECGFAVLVVEGAAAGEPQSSHVSDSLSVVSVVPDVDAATGTCEAYRFAAPTPLFAGSLSVAAEEL